MSFWNSRFRKSTPLASYAGISATNDISAFIKQVRNGPAYLHTNIKNIAACFDKLLDYHHEILRIDPLKALERDFRGICPHCSAWVDEEILGMVWHLSLKDGSKVIMLSYGAISKLRDNHCVNYPNCQSSEIILIWKGSQCIRQQVLDHLERVRQSPELKKYTALPRYLDRLTKPDLLNYVVDSIEAFRWRLKQGSEVSLLNGQKRGDCVIWITVLATSLENSRRFRWSDHLRQLRATPGYDANSQAFFYWIDAADVLNLFIVPEKALAEKDQFYIFPAELSRGQ